MELFKDNYKPLQIRIQACDEVDDSGVIIKEGEEHIISTKIMTPKKIKLMENFEKEVKKNPSKAISEMLELYFDKPAEFWDNYSIDFLTDLIRGVSIMTREIMLKKNSRMKIDSNITS